MERSFIPDYQYYDSEVLYPDYQFCDRKVLYPDRLILIQNNARRKLEKDMIRLLMSSMKITGVSGNCRNGVLFRQDCSEGLIVSVSRTGKACQPEAERNRPSEILAE